MELCLGIERDLFRRSKLERGYLKEILGLTHSEIMGIHKECGEPIAGPVDATVIIFVKSKRMQI